MATRVVQDAHLRVAPDLVGLPLASPSRRALALAVEEGQLDEAARLLATRSLLFSLRFEEDTGPARPPDTLRVSVERLIPGSIRAAALFGVPAVYFTLLTSFGGRTLGKRLAGIRVRRLDGGRLSLADSFERFTGYLQVPAALGTPIADLWRDPNRQLPHDRTVHTVVVRTARPRPRPDPRPDPQEESQPKPKAEPGPVPPGDGPEGPPAGT